MGNITFAKASYQSPYGEVLSDWKIEEGHFLWTVKVPPNTTATVYVPAKDAASLTESAKPVDQTEGVKLLRTEKGRAVFEVGSGRYEFSSRM